MIGLVVQPGVEFDHHKVVDYVPAKATALSAFIETVPGIVYEAHSTDYQTPRALAQLVRDHFAILKVGPGATFALRETLWGLAEIEREWLGEDGGSGFKQQVLAEMREHPGLLAEVLRRARAPVAGPAVQPQRPHPLLLGHAARGAGVRAAAGASRFARAARCR